MKKKLNKELSRSKNFCSRVKQQKLRFIKRRLSSYSLWDEGFRASSQISVPKLTRLKCDKSFKRGLRGGRLPHGDRGHPVKEVHHMMTGANRYLHRQISLNTQYLDTQQDPAQPESTSTSTEIHLDPNNQIAKAIKKLDNKNYQP